MTVSDLTYRFSRSPSLRTEGYPCAGAWAAPINAGKRLNSRWQGWATRAGEPKSIYPNCGTDGQSVESTFEVLLARTAMSVFLSCKAFRLIRRRLPRMAACWCLKFEPQHSLPGRGEILCG